MPAKNCRDRSQQCGDACGDGYMLMKVFVVVNYTLETGYATAH
ncbi:MULTISPECIES: hypothetical protein [unclassified Coleofasciculus]|nr:MULTISPECIES: hypothetical protein [unclassified Coleofasciculus]